MIAKKFSPKNIVTKRVYNDLQKTGVFIENVDESSVPDMSSIRMNHNLLIEISDEFVTLMDVYRGKKTPIIVSDIDDHREVIARVELIINNETAY